MPVVVLPVDPASLVLVPTVTTWAEDGDEIEVLVDLHAPAPPALRRRLVLLLDAFMGDGHDLPGAVWPRLAPRDRLFVVRGGRTPKLEMVVPSRTPWTMGAELKGVRAALHGDVGAGLVRTCAEARRVFRLDWAAARERVLGGRGPSTAAREILDALGATHPDAMPDPVVADELAAAGPHEDPDVRCLLEAALPVDLVAVTGARRPGSVDVATLLAVVRGARGAGVRVHVARPDPDPDDDDDEPDTLVGEIAAAGGGRLVRGPEPAPELVLAAAGIAPTEPVARFATLTVRQTGLLRGVATRGLPWQHTAGGIVLDGGEVPPGQHLEVALRLGVAEDVERARAAEGVTGSAGLAQLELAWLNVARGAYERAEIDVRRRAPADDPHAEIRAWRDPSEVAEQLPLFRGAA